MRKELAKAVHISKTIEVCGFSQENINNYIKQFFSGTDPKKGEFVQSLVQQSYQLKTMAKIPVMLWVLCIVFKEDLVTEPITRNSELYFYACIILLRNHYKGVNNQKFHNLLDMVQDKTIIEVLYSLMVLSVETYMENKVVFTKDEVKMLPCSDNLENSGFLSMYKSRNIKKCTYQFKHLVLQEFLCSLYLCVTKGISPFLSNRELSSCTPTILGIDRILKTGENKLFLTLYHQLLDLHSSTCGFFSKVITSTFKIKSFEKFILDNSLSLPKCMIKGERLIIDVGYPDCQEFLASYDEAYEVNIVFPKFTTAEITLPTTFYTMWMDVRIIKRLLNELKITDINFKQATWFSPVGKSESLEIGQMALGGKYKSKIFINTSTSTNFDHTPNSTWIICDPKILKMNFNIAVNSVIPDIEMLSNDIIKNSDALFIKVRLNENDLSNSYITSSLASIVKLLIHHTKTIKFSMTTKSRLVSHARSNSSLSSRI